MVVFVAVVSALVIGAFGMALLLGKQRLSQLRNLSGAALRNASTGNTSTSNARGGNTGIGTVGTGTAGTGNTGTSTAGNTGNAGSTSRSARWLSDAGLGGVRLRDLVLACAAISFIVFLATLSLFGGVLPALLTALGASGTPAALYRKRRQRSVQEAQEAWPRIIEEIRLLVTNSGKSIPAALFQAGSRAPASLRHGFDMAEREWLLTTDFERSCQVLKASLAHPTCDSVAETLFGAYAVGGVNLESRLRDLSNDRIADLTARKDARSKQAGARFARLFVLVVPIAMALMGLGIGRGKASYQTSTGQILVTVGVLTVMACWYWASRIMVLPAERRVFSQ